MHSTGSRLVTELSARQTPQTEPILDTGAPVSACIFGTVRDAVLILLSCNATITLGSALPLSETRLHCPIERPLLDRIFEWKASLTPSGDITRGHTKL